MTNELKLTNGKLRRRYFPKDNDITTGADKALAEVRKMSAADTEKWLADDVKRGGRCALFTVIPIVIIILAAVAK